MIVKTFASKSSSAEYTTRYDPKTGQGTCDCPGWRYNASRVCTHVKQISHGTSETQSHEATQKSKASRNAQEIHPAQSSRFAQDTHVIEAFVQPMLATPLPADFTFRPDEYAASEKIDGHRLIVHIDSGGVTAWSRLGAERSLPVHIINALSSFPACTLDGELYSPSGKSHNVTELSKSSGLVYGVFDILTLLGTSILTSTYDVRQSYLAEMFARIHATGLRYVESCPVSSITDVTVLRDAVYANGGEGLILKRRAAVYQPGKRSADFLKVKKLQSAVLTIIGFSASKGKINDRGAYAVVRLKDDDGYETSVKTLNDALRAQFEADPDAFIGRRVAIEYQEKIEHSYRHPRFDHLVEIGAEA